MIPQNVGGRNGGRLSHVALGVNAEARKFGGRHGINPATGRRQTGQGRDNIVPYLFS